MLLVTAFVCSSCRVVASVKQDLVAKSEGAGLVDLFLLVMSFQSASSSSSSSVVVVPNWHVDPVLINHNRFANHVGYVGVVRFLRRTGCGPFSFLFLRLVSHSAMDRAFSTAKTSNQFDII